MAARPRPYLAWLAQALPRVGSEHFRRIVTKGLLVALLAVAGCAPLPQSTSAVVVTGYPRVDGSTSTQPLQVLAACKRLGVSCSWREPSDPGALRQIVPDARATQSAPGQWLQSLQHTGTHESYVGLISKKTDLILVARTPSEDEAAAAERAGVQLDVRPVALDAFVILLNRANPVESLHVDQVRMIYMDMLTDWAKLGGTQSAISAYRRNRNSGSQELMEALVMKGEEMPEAPPEMVEQGMGGLVRVVHENPSAIGYIVYYYASNMLYNQNVKMVGIGGVKPTSETIGNRTYPLVAEVYVVLRSDTPAGHPAAVLRDWLLTPEGQATVAESGYVPLAMNR